MCVSSPTPIAIAMGRNSNSKSSKRNPLCEKLLKALGVYPKLIKFGPPQEEAKPLGLQNHDREVEIEKQKVNKFVKMGDTKKEGKKSAEDVNDVFSDYISRAKRRLGSISSKRHDPSSRGKENAKEDNRFSEYIIRARNKLKATSSSSTVKRE